jgi:hypothetical protein
MFSKNKLGGVEINKKVIAFAFFFAVIAVLVLWALQLPEMVLVSENHLPLYEEITAIRNRLTVNITETNFTNPVRVCDFYELREEDSEDYFQTTVNYWVFQHGQQEHGDVEAFVEIYNIPDRTDLFIVEVARFCWFELTVSLDGDVVVVFPTITENVASIGYKTFEVLPTK